MCAAFGRYCSSALAVARCESTLDPAAANGEYLGLFQLSADIRTRRHPVSDPYDAAENAAAAYAVFAEDGYSWREWECQP